jgi:hypothetical protein
LATHGVGGFAIGRDRILINKPELLSATTAHKFRLQSKDFNALSYHTTFGVSSALLLKIFIKLKIWQTVTVSIKDAACVDFIFPRIKFQKMSPF